jgi:Protein of unknown function (DUF3631)
VSENGVPASAGTPRPDGARLLEDIREFIARYLVLPGEEVADLLALWVAHTYVLDSFFTSPYLRVVSAAPESGKSALLQVLELVCHRGWYVISPSSAVLYRKLDRDGSTLLLDEMDLFPLDERQEALAVLNAGYKRGAKVDRCDQKGDLRSFDCFSAKAYAGLDTGSIPPPLLSRSITVRMEKKIGTEPVEWLLLQKVMPEAEELRGRCETWAAENADELDGREPQWPAGIDNRAAELWWPLLVVAEHCGWEDRARRAATVCSTGGDDADEVPQQVLLLSDIRSAFNGQHAIPTATLLHKLNELDESPWGARRRGEGLDARGLARMLRPFKVKPKTVRMGEQRAKGYHWDQFDDVFRRHLPASVTSVTSVTSEPQSQADVTDVTDVTHLEGPDAIWDPARDQPGWDKVGI